MNPSCIIIEIKPQEIRRFTFTISDVWGYADLLMHILQFMISYVSRVNSLKLRQNDFYSYIKMTSVDSNRIFIYISKDKYISVINPFNYHIESGRINFRLNGIVITEKICSNIISIILDWKNNGGNRSLGVFEFLASYDDEDIDPNSFVVLEQLLLTEPGYIRHDDDIQNQRGLIHPRTHFDINFSKKATFKIGTYDMYDAKNFEGLFCKNEDCKFLYDYQERSLIKRQKLKKKTKKNKKNGKRKV